MKVFLSYDRRDVSAANAIRSRLRKEGIDVWSDDELLPGQSWVSQIYEAISSSDVVVFLLSKRSSESSSIRSEISAAVATKSADQQKVIIPALLERDVSAPFFLRDYQWLDLSDDWERGLTTLVETLRHWDQQKELKDRGIAQDVLTIEERLLEEERREYEIDRVHRQAGLRGLWTTALSTASTLVAILLATISLIPINYRPIDWVIFAVVIFTTYVGALLIGFRAGKLSGRRNAND